MATASFDTAVACAWAAVVTVGLEFDVDEVGSDVGVLVGVSEGAAVAPDWLVGLGVAVDVRVGVGVEVLPFPPPEGTVGMVLPLPGSRFPDHVSFPRRKCQCLLTSNSIVFRPERYYQSTHNKSLLYCCFLESDCYLAFEL